MRLLKAIVGTLFLIANTVVLGIVMFGIFFLTRWTISSIFFVGYNNVWIVTISIAITVTLITPIFFKVKS